MIFIIQDLHFKVKVPTTYMRKYPLGIEQVAKMWKNFNFICAFGWLHDYLKD